MSAIEPSNVHHPIEEFFSTNDVLFLIIFLGCVWVSGRIAMACKMPSLVGELVVGSLLGPPLANMVPFPEALSLVGQLGLVLLVVESGMEVELPMLKAVGLRSALLAFVGSVFGPLLIALGLCVAVGLPVRVGLAVGASLSPTSMGCAVIIFKSARVLNTSTSQMIMSAAVLDDIIGLVLLSELKALANPSTKAFVVPVVSAVCFLVGVGFYAIYLLPLFLTRVLLPRVPPAHVEVACLLLLFVSVIGLAEALNAGQASYMLGAFLGGLQFCELKSMKDVWHSQVKRIQGWLLRLFFSATVGFLIPIRHLWTPSVWSLGCLFLVPTLGKIQTGMLAKPLTRDAFLTVATAMSARGEFAFLVANTALSSGAMDEHTHAAVMLAIVLSLIAAPSSLRAVIASQQRRAKAALDEALEATSTRGGGGGGLKARVFYKLAVRCLDRWGLVPEVQRVLAKEGVEVLDLRIATADGFVLMEAYLRDATLFDSSPETREAEGLEARIERLRDALLALMAHDEEATGRPAHPSAAAAAAAGLGAPAVGDGSRSGGGGDGDGDGDKGARKQHDAAAAAAPPPPHSLADVADHEVDFGTLRGLRLTRWMPGASAAEWAERGRAGNEALAEAVMREEALRIIGAAAGGNGPLLLAAGGGTPAAGGAAGPSQRGLRHRARSASRLAIAEEEKGDEDDVEQGGGPSHAHADAAAAEAVALSDAADAPQPLPLPPPQQPLLAAHGAGGRVLANSVLADTIISGASALSSNLRMASALSSGNLVGMVRQTPVNVHAAGATPVDVVRTMSQLYAPAAVERTMSMLMGAASVPDGGSVARHGSLVLQPQQAAASILRHHTMLLGASAANRQQQQAAGAAGRGAGAHQAAAARTGAAEADFAAALAVFRATVLEQEIAAAAAAAASAGGGGAAGS